METRETDASQIAKKRLPLQQGRFQGPQVRATQGFKCIPWVLVAGLAVDRVDVTYTHESLMHAVAERLEGAGLLFPLPDHHDKVIYPELAKYSTS